MRIALALVLLLASAVFAGAGAARYVISIRDMKFGVLPAHLRKGDTLVWRNQDIFRHTATAKDGSFDLRLDPDAQGQTVLSKSGTFAVFCRYHPTMTARLAVAEK